MSRHPTKFIKNDARKNEIRHSSIFKFIKYKEVGKKYYMLGLMRMK
jgi:hypothetical protein